MNLVDEIKRRNVHKFTGIYVVAAWLLLQVADVISPILELAPWTSRFLLIVLLIGFPIAGVISWMYDLSIAGITRDIAPTSDPTLKLGTTLTISFIVFSSAAYYTYSTVSEGRGLFDILSRTVAPNSIAVLPFENLSSDEEQAYFSDGLAEDILNVLAQVPELQVTSRSSSFLFRERGLPIPEIGDRLGVANILEGSVRRVGDDLRITAQLVDARTEKYLTSESYDRKASDIFAVQDEISLAIVDALKLELGIYIATPVIDAGTTNVEAHSQYLMGRFEFVKRTEDDLTTGLEHFRRAVEIDPEYAPAWSGLADTYAFLSERNYGSMGHIDSLRRAKPNAERALSLNPNLPEAHASMHFIMMMEGNLDENFPYLRRAIELNPSFARAHFWLGNALEIEGRYDEAFIEFKLAKLLDPQDLLIGLSLARSYAGRGEFSELNRVVEDMMAIDEEHELTVIAQQLLFDSAQDYASALVLRQATVDQFDDFDDRILLAMELKRLGLTEDVFSSVAPLIDSDLEPWAYVVLGEMDKAIESADDYPVPTADREALTQRAWIDVFAGRYNQALVYYDVLDVCGNESFNASDCLYSAFALRAAGNAVGSNSALARVREEISHWRSTGVKYHYHLSSYAPISYLEAGSLLVEGNVDEAVNIYEQLIDDGYVFILEYIDPFFTELRGHSEWAALKERMENTIRRQLRILTRA
jgi:adenylate cyclase